MSQIQTLFSQHSIAGPLEKPIVEHLRKTKAIITDPANRALVIGITAAKLVAGGLAAYGISTDNKEDVIVATVMENVAGYWFIPPIVAVRDYFKKKAHAAAMKITVPVRKIQQATKAPVLALAKAPVPFSRMLPPGPHAPAH